MVGPPWMTLEQARDVLGLGPTDCPSDHMEKLVEARERLATMVRDAPNDTIALRYQESLQEFDRAMAALREEAERLRKQKMAAMLALVPGAVTGEKIETKREGFLDEPMVPIGSPGKVRRTAQFAPPSPAEVAREELPAV